MVESERNHVLQILFLQLVLSNNSIILFQNVDPDSSLEVLLEGMAIEENGQQHRVKI
jgi:hypothetical protein